MLQGIKMIEKLHQRYVLKIYLRQLGLGGRSIRVVAYVHDGLIYTTFTFDQEQSMCFDTRTPRSTAACLLIARNQHKETK